jgi:hypothetical protein
MPRRSAGSKADRTKGLNDLGPGLLDEALLHLDKAPGEKNEGENDEVEDI